MENTPLKKTTELQVRYQGKIGEGLHVIGDLWQCQHLDNIDYIEKTLKEAVVIGNATLLHISLHHFTENAGVSGVAILAESHISIHTWPEKNYAAVDIFMCGDTQPEKAMSHIIHALAAERSESQVLLRGYNPDIRSNI